MKDQRTKSALSIRKRHFSSNEIGELGKRFLKSVDLDKKVPRYLLLSVKITLTDLRAFVDFEPADER